MSALPVTEVPTRLVFILIVAVLVTGTGWLALLPPWEGFDETAHFSSIQQIADTGTLPRLGNSYLSRDVVGYADHLPTKYLSEPPFDEYRGITYQRFHAAPITDAAKLVLGHPRQFVPSDEANWQSQHPPLYYAIMAPAYLVSAGWSWPAQLLLMRTISWLIAMAGFALGLAGIYRYWCGRERADACAIAAAWPFLVPMFFPEMARLGNDSLCLLLAGAIWFLLMRLAAKGAQRRDGVLLGLLLGLGLLTKAFFLPITAGVLAYLAVRRDFGIAGIALVLAALIGGPWYVYNYLDYGIATGAYEEFVVADQGGLRAGLAAQFSFGALAHGLAGIVATVSRPVTWSLAKLPEFLLVPLVALLLLPLGAYAFGLLRTRQTDIVWAPVLIVGAVVAGLVHHVLVRIALTGIGTGTPGWYLHLLVGPLGFAYAVGVLRLVHQRFARRILPPLTIYTLGYFAVVSWIQLLMYSGCIGKGQKYYAWPTDLSCTVDMPDLYRHLSLTTEPQIGLAFLVVGIGLGSFALALLWIRLTRDTA
jgi:hypothetical protein